jgi:hypothetical protein
LSLPHPPPTPQHSHQRTMADHPTEKRKAHVNDEGTKKPRTSGYAPTPAMPGPSSFEEELIREFGDEGILFSRRSDQGGSVMGLEHAL